MSSFSIAPAQSEDFAAILALQDQNHLSALPEETLASGFVTTQLSLDTLEEMRLNKGIWIARADDDGPLAAYACANDWEFYGDGPFQRAAKALLPHDVNGRTVTPNNTFQYGPVCIAPEYRGQSLLERMVAAIKTHYAPRFEFVLTFIDVRNARSLAAHERKLGFHPIALLPFGSVTYHMLAFPTH